MPIDLSTLDKCYDLCFEIPLRVRQGHRFQPTGFPDLGAAEFETPEGSSLLVESAQSMANRLEAVCWDDGKNDLIEELSGLSYVEVLRDGKYLTSSVTDSHRLNSPYILESKDRTFFTELQTELGALEAGPMNRALLARALFKFDVGSLLHGVFLAKKELAGGRLRLARAVAAFIEADGVMVAASGGSKQDHVDPSGAAFGQGGAEKGFGHVPFPRDEYTARRITLYASIDLDQIRGYNLGDDATRMLILLALFKLRAFIESPMRLRTACHFDVASDANICARNVSDFELPGRMPLLEDLKPLIKALSGEDDSKMRKTPVAFKA